MNSAQMNDTKAVLEKVIKSESTPERVIEALCLRILARKPTEAESRKLVAYVAKESDPAAGYRDVLWVFLNSGEFVMQH